MYSIVLVTILHSVLVIASFPVSIPLYVRLLLALLPLAQGTVRDRLGLLELQLHSIVPNPSHPSFISDPLQRKAGNSICMYLSSHCILPEILIMAILLENAAMELSTAFIDLAPYPSFQQPVRRHWYTTLK